MCSKDKVFKVCCNRRVKFCSKVYEILSKQLFSNYFNILYASCSCFRIVWWIVTLPSQREVDGNLIFVYFWRTDVDHCILLWCFSSLTDHSMHLYNMDSQKSDIQIYCFVTLLFLLLINGIRTFWNNLESYFKSAVLIISLRVFLLLFIFGGNWYLCDTSIWSSLLKLTGASTWWKNLKK